MFQTIFNQSLYGRGETRRLSRRLRRWILRWKDPVVSWELNGRKLQLPLSHELPQYRSQFPTYAGNLERLAYVIRGLCGKLAMIDVGANIGDSIALAGMRAGDAALLVEGDARYFALLERNTAGLPGVVCVSAMLSDQAGSAPGRLVTQGGTGRIVSGAPGNPAPVTTLDRMLESYPQFRACPLLKIDVDGYDFRVLRGAAALVRGTQPILFFEQDPALLKAAMEDADAVWDWLVKAGYTALFVYDNLGFWLGTFPAADLELLRQLNAYARQRQGYYDIAAFAPRHQDLQKTFAAGERAFYATG